MKRGVSPLNITQKLLNIIIKQKPKLNVKKMCQVNYLSEKQTQTVLACNSFQAIRDAINNLQNEPDCEYLAKVLLPPEKDVFAVKSLNPKDVVKATILGDIIGSKYEFAPHDYEKVRTMTLPPISARYTDDTVLSIATMNAVLKNDVTPDFATEYKKAYHAHPHAGYGGSFINWSTSSSTQGYHSMANGSIMRVSFIAAYYDDVRDVIKHTIESAMTTHNHVEGVKGAVIVAVCIWMALHGYTKKEIWSYCKRHYYVIDKNLLLNKGYYFDLTQKLEEIKLPPNRNTLFCSFVTPYIIKCFCETDSYDECMRELLSRFGDTDTMCAVAGGLCFAFDGVINFDVDDILAKHSVNI